MDLRTRLTRFVWTAVKLIPPILSQPPVASLSQKCHLSTLRTIPHISSDRLGLKLADQISCVHKQKLLSPFVLASVNVPVRDYHSVLRPRLHCKGCYFVWRHGRKFVECSDVPSHKQMKKVLNRKLWREDYTKGNVRKAMIWNRDKVYMSARMCDRDTLLHNWLASRIGKDV